MFEDKSCKSKDFTNVYQPLVRLCIFLSRLAIKIIVLGELKLKNDRVLSP